MKANEMQRYRYQNDFPNDYDGIVDDKDGELVFYEDAMQVIQALEAKIKGMIERPTVEAFMLTPNAKGSSGLYVNEVWCGDLPNAEAYILVKRLTKALGMEGQDHA